MARVKDRRGCLPIHLAAWNGHVEVIQVIIINGKVIAKHIFTFE